MLGCPHQAAVCVGWGSEVGRAGGKKVVCLEGQRQVAAIALRAPCSGIKIKDDKQTETTKHSHDRDQDHNHNYDQDHDHGHHQGNGHAPSSFHSHSHLHSNSRALPPPPPPVPLSPSNPSQLGPPLGPPPRTRTHRYSPSFARLPLGNGYAFSSPDPNSITEGDPGPAVASPAAAPRKKQSEAFAADLHSYYSFLLPPPPPPPSVAKFWLS